MTSFASKRHFRKHEEKYLKEVFPGHLFHAVLGGKNGVFVLVLLKELERSVSSMFKDPEGQVLIIKGTVNGML